MDRATQLIEKKSLEDHMLLNEIRIRAHDGPSDFQGNPQSEQEEIPEHL